MTDGESYAGTVVLEDGWLLLPAPYDTATQFVVRQRLITQNLVAGATVDRVQYHGPEEEGSEYGVQNKHLDHGEVELKLYGEQSERYRITVNDE